jgi:hypothetical protein
MTTAALFHAPSPVASSRRIARRSGAVLAGLLAIFATTTAIDIVFHVTEVFPPLGQPMGSALFGLALGYRILCGIAGCYVTARLAPDRPLRDALALGALGVVLSTAGAVAMWDAGPAWYPLAVIAISVPCAYLGGALRERQLRVA